jgi:dihydrolipoamide dehydrogenase
MADRIEIKVPDIGDFDDVDVIEVLVAAGDTVDVDQGLITLETDKATMDVPATEAGTVVEVKVSAGDKVQQGDVILTLEPTAASGGNDEEPSEEPKPQSEPAPDFDGRDADLHAGVLVLGSGPGGYTAAFRAADLGAEVVLVERYESLGGVCLNVGCIPSKALLHAAHVIDAADEMAEHGVSFGPPKIDLDQLRAWKDKVVDRLTGGLGQMAKQRDVTAVHGVGTFVGPHHLEVKTADGTTLVSFDHAIVAAGSRVIEIPGIPWDDPRVMDSTGALELADVPKRLLVVGGGIIGLEMATVYAGLGSKVTVVELLDRLIPGADPDLVKPLAKRLGGKLEAIHMETRVEKVEAKKKALVAHFAKESGDAPEPAEFDRVLVAVGRRPNGDRIGAEAAGLEVDERGFLRTDKEMRTNVPHIFAIGDLVGQPMLAHKATHEGKVAAEVACGEKSAFDARVIPSVAYTDPEVAWVGLTETEAKAEGIAYEKGTFPWAASGRALGMAREEGLTKLLFDPETHQVLGGGVVGLNAGDLIAEIAHAVEMGSEAADIGLTIHPHPTLSETIAFAAEAYEGTITDLYLPKQKKARKARAQKQSSKTSGKAD